MPYLIQTFDKPGASAIRQEVREDHLNYLSSIAEALLACGAKLDDSGSAASGGIYLVDVESREEAEQIIENDPYYIHGLFRHIEISRWRRAFLAGERYI